MIQKKEDNYLIPTGWRKPSGEETPSKKQNVLSTDIINLGEEENEENRLRWQSEVKKAF